MSDKIPQELTDQYKSPHQRKVIKRRAIIRDMVSQNKSVREIMAELAEQNAAVSKAMVYRELKEMGLKARPVKPGRTATADDGDGSDKSTQKKLRAAHNARQKIRDRRRHKVVPVPMGSFKTIANEEAIEEGRTVFPTRVFMPGGPDTECVLKDGCNNSKIGGDVLVGRLKGAYICTLTLQERATCPRSCRTWDTCYGNQMQHSRRWAAGQQLIDSLRIEIAEACAANDKVLIRLHVLGDFYSEDYVTFWGEMLRDHENLFTFGFTAWAPDTEIGSAIVKLRKSLPDRFMIRNSGSSGPWGSVVLPFAPDPDHANGYPSTVGDIIVCPEQRDAISRPEKGTHCGSCAQCWQHNYPIGFIAH